jgi:CheY-like chemotaxis protein
VPPPSDSDRRPAIARLHDIRSLILSDEDDFRAHVLAVIADLGPVAFARIAITAADDPADVVALVLHERPDVLLLDATGRESAVRRAVRALAESPVRVGVVVVCEHSTPAARQLGALPKWGWTQDLRGAVEQAFVEGRAPAPSPPGPLAGWADRGPRRED